MAVLSQKHGQPYDIGPLPCTGRAGDFGGHPAQDPGLGGSLRKVFLPFFFLLSNIDAWKN